jgi:hypothetical protein
MNFGTAASIGLELIQGSNGMGAVLKGALGAAKLTQGKGFAQVAQKLGLSDGLSEKLGQQVGQAVGELANAMGSHSGTQVLNALQYFDADKNGAMTRDELTQGLQKLQDLGLSQSGATAKLYQMGDNLLKNYERLAAQDGNATTLSFKDVGALMGKDGQATTLSKADWQTLNA